MKIDLEIRLDEVDYLRVRYIIFEHFDVMMVLIEELLLHYYTN